MYKDNSKYLEQLIQDASIEFAERLVVTVGLIFLVWLIRKVVLKFVRKRSKTDRTSFVWNKYSYYVFFFISLIIIIDLWFKGFSNMVTLLGLLVAGIAFALKEPIVNLFGWVYIVWRGPIKAGDRIEIDNRIGDVIEITPFHFDLLEIRNWIDGDLYTGRIVSIPNAKVFNDVNFNYSSGYTSIWNEVRFRITFESDWKKAKAIIIETAKANSNYQDTEATFDAYKTLRSHMIFDVEFEPQVFTKVVENGVELRCRYFCSIYSRTVSESAITEQILEAFNSEETITFAYRTTRFYKGDSEPNTGALE